MYPESRPVAHFLKSQDVNTKQKFKFKKTQKLMKENQNEKLHSILILSTKLVFLIVTSLILLFDLRTIALCIL